ncbi:MAG: Gfo/Idh/MocA family oxidoreductase [Clostridia bacterium]|nr:Gfo/Idh/MocA family oxidoreductase [Clostridia bacterium]
MEKIKIGIFGLRRGSSFIDEIRFNGGEIVAVCEKDEEHTKTVLSEIEGAAVYTDFDEFIKHPMDAVLIANFCPEHAGYAVKCLEKNIHVLSECLSNGTLAEGVKLVEAAEKSSAIYMLAENYPYMTFNREMRRVYESGTLGKIMYAEGEYNHPIDWYDTKTVLSVRPYEKHWRNFLPRTYYITHSLAPLMAATHSKPVRVTAMPVYAPLPEDCPTQSHVADAAAIITILNDDNSVFKVTGCSAFGAHGNSYRLCCEKGQIENVRGTDKVMLRYNSWQIPEGKEEVNFYEPDLSDKDEELIKNAGHGGGDFFVIKEFFDSIRSAKPHMFDVYFATSMASVAILSHRSILEGSKPYDIPDFRKKEDRDKFRDDTLSPFWHSDGTPPSIPCCSDPNYLPSLWQTENCK